MGEWSFHPEPRSKPISVREAFVGVADAGAPELPAWLRLAAKEMKAGNFSSDHVERAFLKFKETKGGAINTKLLAWNKPSCTLVKSEIAATGIIHPGRQRYCSVAELKRLASFPDDFLFPPSLGRNNAVERIGNSVPPLPMKAIATNIKDAPFMEAIERPTAVDLFSGCGGSSLGLKMAGFRELLAVEWDDNAAATFRLNFPDVDLFHGDIAELTSQEVLRRTGLRPGELDLLTGSPPCQGFSTAGKRKYNDPRNGLFMEYARLLRDLQPKAFVMENVTGMVKGHMKQAYLGIVAELRSCGYVVKGQVMNAMYYGVPQSRERVIVVGVREDLDAKPSHPKPHSQPIPADQAIKNAVVDDCGNPASRIAAMMRQVKPGCNLGKIYGSYFSYVRCPVDRPCMTLQKSVSFGGVTIFHPYEHRNLSISELKRIASFPDDFMFCGNYEDAVNRMGNSVPPRLMQAISSHIKEAILLHAPAPP